MNNNNYSVQPNSMDLNYSNVNFTNQVSRSSVNTNNTYNNNSYSVQPNSNNMGYSNVNFTNQINNNVINRNRNINSNNNNQSSQVGFYDPNNKHYGLVLNSKQIKQMEKVKESFNTDGPCRTTGCSTNRGTCETDVPGYPIQLYRGDRVYFKEKFI